MSNYKKQLDLCKKNLCPQCSSDQIEGQQVEIMNGTASQDMSCTDCDAEWREHYIMNDFSFYAAAEPHLLERAISL